MNKLGRNLFKAVIWLLLYACYQETPVRINADFDVEITGNDYSVPVTVHLMNKSTGADLYEWTFEGGDPLKSNKVNPEEVVYKEPGTYTIRLEAWNTTERKVKELTVSLDSAIGAGFTYTVAINNFSPVEVTLINCSYGGTRYRWEFIGGQPETYEGKNPPVIVFTEPGLHPVHLQVFNSRERAEFTDTIRVLPALAVDFEWWPGKDDYDMEAPLVIELAARCTGVLSYLWKAEGGRIENDTLADTRIYFDKPGEYRVELKAANGKETKSVSKEIKVLENSNLYIIQDLKFGITTALNTVGGYFSSETRSVLKMKELTPVTGPTIDFVFWGLADFDQCCFLSPDLVGLKALPDIPGAAHSWFINNPDALTAGQFDVMENDELLKRLLIRENCDKDLNSYFTGNDVPHLVLFETGDYRKGVIKIKQFVQAGSNSYILADVKIQKERTGN